jgi:S-formylglutathione hydrolase FrmB
MLGEPADRILTIYLPPSYYSSQKRYPAVYYLPGFQEQDLPGVTLPDDVDNLIQDGTIKEMIVVVASGVNVLGGSFFVNSPVAGNWDDFITKDVVGFMDANYRTLPQPASRGITGDSMGGFGALNLSMLHPDVFGWVYSLSPSLFDPNGLSESQMFSSQSSIDSMVDAEERERVLSAENALSDMKMSSGDIQFSMAYAVAFAPDAQKIPPYDYPYRRENGKIVRDDLAWQKWTNGFGSIVDKIQLYQENLGKLTGIAIGYWPADPAAWIPKGDTYFAAQLTQAGIANQLVASSGDNQPDLGDRIRRFVLPYFSQNLKFDN